MHHKEDKNSTFKNLAPSKHVIFHLSSRLNVGHYGINFTEEQNLIAARNISGDGSQN
jgi:hypothetical protein